MPNAKVTIIIGLILIAVAFYGGLKYGQNRQSSGNNIRQMAAAGQFAGRTARAGGGLTAGTILSLDAKSLTLRLRAGGSKIVLFSTSTEVQKTTQGGVSDLTIGDSISVSGSTNADGSITASSIQLRPNPTQANTN